MSENVQPGRKVVLQKVDGKYVIFAVQIVRLAEATEKGRALELFDMACEEARHV